MKYNSISEFFIGLLDFIYKKECVICHSKKENTFFCSRCKTKIPFNSFYPIKFINYLEVFSCTNYSDVAKEMVKLLKFHNKKFLAKEIAKYCYDYLSKINIDFSDYEIICVPLHIKKQKNRGFNQCELIAKELSSMMNIPCNFKLVKKIKNTKPMYKLTYLQRLENLKDAFEVDKKEFHNKKLLLIDDITTTGTTLYEVTTELLKNDIKDITCFTFTNTGKNLL